MLYSIWLNTLQNLPTSKAKQLINSYGNPKAVYEALLEARGPKEINLETAKHVLDACHRQNISILPYSDYGIPNFPDLPLLLYYKGKLRKNTYSVGIVGSRRCTEYGKRATAEIVDHLVSQDTTIISGMAKGIDGYAHSACILSGGYTIAVLGCGPDICFPSEHRSLMQSIEENGLILSQFPPGTQPTTYTFPLRNQIIAAFSKKLLVAEAAPKSGSLITADYAYKYGIPVYALPGAYNSRESEGCHNLIANNRAKIYTPGCLDNISEQLSIPACFLSESKTESKLTKKSGPKTNQDLTPAETSLISILHENHKSLSITRLMEILSLSRPEIMNLVLNLELKEIAYTQGDVLWLQ